MLLWIFSISVILVGIGVFLYSTGCQGLIPWLAGLAFGVGGTLIGYSHNQAFIGLLIGLALWGALWLIISIVQNWCFVLLYGACIGLGAYAGYQWFGGTNYSLLIGAGLGLFLALIISFKKFRTWFAKAIRWFWGVLLWVPKTLWSLVPKSVKTVLQTIWNVMWLIIVIAVICWVLSRLGII